MSTQPTNCPLCNPSLVVTTGIRLCAGHKGANKNPVVVSILAITRQENVRAAKCGLVADLTMEQVGMARWFFSLPAETYIRTEACAYCRKPANTGLDHWIPISRGGGSTVTNVLPCCHVCNTMKNMLTGDEFLDVLINDIQSLTAIESKKHIELYWSLVQTESHAVYEYCSTRKNSNY